MTNHKDQSQPETISVFKTPEGEAQYLKAYDEVLGLSPIPHEPLLIPTRFGQTRINAYGPADGVPLVLLPGQFASSTMWFSNVGEFSRQYRVYTVDTMGEPGGSKPSRLIGSVNDFMLWLTDVFDSLAISRAHIGGLSYGGWLALNFSLFAPQRILSLILLDPVSSFSPLSMKFVLRMIVPFFISPTRQNLVGFFRWMTRGKIVNARWGELMVIGITHFKIQARVNPTVFKDKELRSLSLPVLLLLGEQSVIYNPKTVIARARRLIQGVKAEIIPDASHGLNMEQADMVNRKVLEFMGGIGL